MPCLFGSVDKERVMVIHASLAAARVKKVADGKRYVLCGDFNIKPSMPVIVAIDPRMCCRRIRRSGRLPNQMETSSRRSSLLVDPPLKSAYVVATGKEPDFTDFAYTKPMGSDMDAFVETLNYVASGRAGP